jgi:hypothetical protein
MKVRGGSAERRGSWLRMTVPVACVTPQELSRDFPPPDTNGFPAAPHEVTSVKKLL